MTEKILQHPIFGVLLLLALAFFSFRLLQTKRRRKRLAEKRYKARMEAGVEGENQVIAHLEHWLSRHPRYKMLEKDCQGRYGTSGILMKNPPLFPKTQEIDHILVGPIGVITIETKNYSGEINVLDNDTWNRRRPHQENWQKQPSPAGQAGQHQKLLASLLGENVPVYSLICVANPQAVIRHARRSHYPILPLQKLERYLNRLARRRKRLNRKQVKEAFCTLENAKVDL